MGGVISRGRDRHGVRIGGGGGGTVAAAATPGGEDGPVDRRGIRGERETARAADFPGRGSDEHASTTAETSHATLAAALAAVLAAFLAAVLAGRVGEAEEEETETAPRGGFLTEK